MTPPSNKGPFPTREDQQHNASTETDLPIPGAPVSEKPLLKFADETDPSDRERIKTSEFEKASSTEDMPIPSKSAMKQIDLSDLGKRRASSDGHEVKAVVDLNPRHADSSQKPTQQLRVVDESEVDEGHSQSHKAARSDATDTYAPSTNKPWKKESSASDSTPNDLRRTSTVSPAGSQSTDWAANKASQVLSQHRRSYADDQTGSSEQRAAPNFPKSDSSSQRIVDREADFNPWDETESGQRSPARSNRPASDAPAAKPESKSTPGSTNGPRYAVILQPNARVKHAELIDQLAAFLNQGVTETRRAVRHGKGILSRDMSKSEALVLDAALNAENHPTKLVEQSAGLDFQQPEPVETLACRQGNIRALNMTTRFVLEPANLKLLGAGLVKTDQPNQLQLVVELYGNTTGNHWRMVESITANQIQSKDRPVADLLDLLSDLADTCPDVYQTPVFELMSCGKLSEKHAFPSWFDFDNYHQWLLWATFGKTV
jgi:hypothetical protein